MNSLLRHKLIEALVKWYASQYILVNNFYIVTYITYMQYAVRQKLARRITSWPFFAGILKIISQILIYIIFVIMRVMLSTHMIKKWTHISQKKKIINKYILQANIYIRIDDIILYLYLYNIYNIITTYQEIT